MLNDVIGIVECDDCGLSIICDPSFVSVEDFFGTYFASTICSFCERPITSEISEEVMKEFKDVGVLIVSVEDNIND